MYFFDLLKEQEFRMDSHVRKILAHVGEGEVAVACWEPGQVSPYHTHPNATEIYFCFQGGGIMKTPEETVPITPGSVIVYPCTDWHEYTNGPKRTLLLRIRYGKDLAPQYKA